MIHCLKCDGDVPPMSKSPYPGKLGQEVLEHICESCWAAWQKFSVNVINDYKLKPFLPRDRGILEDNLKKFLNLSVGASLTAPSSLSNIGITLSGQGKEVTFDTKGTNVGTDEVTKEIIIERLEQVYDPEIPVNVYDLGLIYGIDIDQGKVTIRMTLTTKNCPAAQSLPDAVKQIVSRTRGVKEAHVDLVWEPVWTKDMISEEGKSALGMH